MPAKIIEGNTLAAQIRDEAAQEAAIYFAREGRKVRLCCVQVGENPASVLYVKNQARQCASVGIEFQLVQLPAEASQTALLHKIHELNLDTNVNSIILQLPLPSQFNTAQCQRAIHPNKDAEGVHPVNLGLLVYGIAHHAPCTAMSAYSLIKSTGEELRGLECVVVGHSQIVGKPVSLMMLHDFCTVTTCHIATRDLAAHTKRADILIVAVGKARLIRADMVKPGAMVIDVGVNRVPVLDASGQQVLNEKGKPAHKTVGDVEEGAADVAGWITPVPGGVGPVTVSILLRNVVHAALHPHPLYA